MHIVRVVLLLVGTMVLALLIAGHLNRLHPALDSIGHFRLHLAVTGLIIGILLLASKSLLGGSALLIVSAFSLFTTGWPVIGVSKAQAMGDAGATYRLLQTNLRFDNSTPEEFVRLLGETKPDIVTIEEISEMWAAKLTIISAMYPFQFVCPGRDKIGGVAILSRRPFVDGALAHCDGEGAVAVQTVDVAGQPVTILAMHLEWPWPKMQPQQLIALKPLFKSIIDARNPVLIGGDMNATPWSAAISKIAEGTGTSVLPQVWGTWFFVNLPKSLAPWLGLPIDNILHSQGITLRSAKTQRIIGSDHRPILVEFSLPPKADSAAGEALSGGFQRAVENAKSAMTKSTSYALIAAVPSVRMTRSP